MDLSESRTIYISQVPFDYPFLYKPIVRDCKLYNILSVGRRHQKDHSDVYRTHSGQGGAIMVGCPLWRGGCFVTGRTVAFVRIGENMVSTNWKSGENGGNCI